jgi:stage II sporulation protein D
LKPPGFRLARLALAALPWVVSCATAPPPPLPSAAEKPVPIPETRVAVPTAAAPSGVLYRVGLKSDLTEFSAGTAGTLWIVASGERAELLQGPLTFRVSGAPAGSPSFQVQAGAFSQEAPAHQLLDRLVAAYGTPGEVAFSADRGLYRVLIGTFAVRADADAFVQKLRAAGQESFVAPGAPRPEGLPAVITVSGGANGTLSLPSPVDVYPPAPDVRVVADSASYRGSLRVLVNPRGTLNVVNRVDLEEYLLGVVPAEMGPKRFDAIEALKAQAVAARTYALAHRGQFEGEGYDICATPMCQVYAGVAAEDPLTQAAVDGTRGLVLAWQGKYADALFVSTCGGRTENVENVFSGGPVPYLVSVACGELPTVEILGATVPRGAGREPRTALEWRGYVLRRGAPRRSAVRAANLETARRWAGVSAAGPAPPGRLSPAFVYPSLVTDFQLTEARALQLLPRDEAYFGEQPSAVPGLTGAARTAYEFLLRFRFAGSASLPPADRDLSEEEYAGLLFSIALRLGGLTEGSGRFLEREGANLWVKTTEGRQGVPVDPDVPLARRIGDLYGISSTLTLRPGDRLRWWKYGSRLVGLWVEMGAEGPTYERESAWTEWVRRVSARELARRMAGRVAGNEVRSITVTKRSPSGRAIEMRVQTDLAEATFQRFDVRQAVEMPEMLFTVSKVAGANGEAEFVFLGRGWGHGVGLCQNGAFGMALAGATYDAILRHYYSGIDIVTASSIGETGPASTR